MNRNDFFNKVRTNLKNQSKISYVALAVSIIALVMQLWKSN
jgi:hypothetical protein